MSNKEKCPKCGFTMNVKGFCPNNCDREKQRPVKYDFSKRGVEEG
jgi:hypothetical protein